MTETPPGDAGRPQLDAEIRRWLSQDKDGAAILKALSEDPVTGAAMLIGRLQGGSLPNWLQTSISGGEIGYIINVASQQAQLSFGGDKHSRGFFEERLRLGWQFFHTATMVSAGTIKDSSYMPAEFQVRQVYQEINDVFSTDVSPPVVPMPPRNQLSWVTNRIEGKDPVGANVFRLGGAFNLWWNFKGRHGDQMDDELWKAVADALEQLNSVLPGAEKRLFAMLAPLMHEAGENDDVPVLMNKMASALAS